MAYTSNIRAFFGTVNPDPLVSSYRLLVALELALKDGNCSVHGRSSGHDVPGMLLVAASLPTVGPMIAAQLSSLAQTLRNNLGVILCQGKGGTPQAVAPDNYPHLRYGRFAGDWAGVAETPAQRFSELEATCRSVCLLLSSHGPSFGVHL